MHHRIEKIFSSLLTSPFFFRTYPVRPRFTECSIKLTEVGDEEAHVYYINVVVPRESKVRCDVHRYFATGCTKYPCFLEKPRNRTLHSGSMCSLHGM